MKKFLKFKKYTANFLILITLLITSNSFAGITETITTGQTVYGLSDCGNVYKKSIGDSKWNYFAGLRSTTDIARDENGQIYCLTANRNIGYALKDSETYLIASPFNLLSFAVVDQKFYAVNSKHEIVIGNDHGFWTNHLPSPPSSALKIAGIKSDFVLILAEDQKIYLFENGAWSLFAEAADASQKIESIEVLGLRTVQATNLNGQIIALKEKK